MWRQRRGSQSPLQPGHQQLSCCFILPTSTGAQTLTHPACKGRNTPCYTTTDMGKGYLQKANKESVHSGCDQTIFILTQQQKRKRRSLQNLSDISQRQQQTQHSAARREIRCSTPSMKGSYKINASR